MARYVNAEVTKRSGLHYHTIVAPQILSVWRMGDLICLHFRQDNGKSAANIKLPGNTATALAKALSFVAEGHAESIEIRLSPATITHKAHKNQQTN